MERIRSHLSFANVAAGLALLFSMTGGAIAATGGFSSGGKLQACVNEEGTLKLLKAGRKCKKGQKALSWNQTGPAGATGAKGATGATGAAGAPGAAGSNGQNGASAPGTTLWAKVDVTGQLIAGSGVTATKLSGTATFVDFDRDLTKCALVASQQGQSTAVYVSFVELFNGSTNRVIVQAAGSGPTQVASAISLEAICP
jgi:hypothetical protein